ncbi:Ig-like domain-containing protein [Nocardioides caricicola]|uniref:Ig-like domain-containing protein n=1 Tax=Nocardioides caricicola TaxID=634770 RepID=A0ABW0MWB3_9ACTN
MLISARLRALTAACVVAAGLAVGVAPAAQALPPVTWTGAVDALWSEPGNWDTGSVPGPVDDVVFPPAVGRTDMVNDLPGGAYFSSIAFTGAGYRVSGNGVQLVAGLAVNHGTGTTTLDVPVTLDGGGTAYVTGGTTLDLDGTLSAAVVNLDGGGTLQVDGTLLSPIVLANGSRLTGSGSLSGTAIGATGASTISPGTADGPGNLSYTPASHLSLPSGSTLHVDIDGPIAASGYDRLTLSDPSALFNPNGATLDVDLGYRPAVNSSFQIVSQGVGTPITGRFNGLSQFSSFTSEGVTFSVGYFNTGIVLTVTAVDVPSGTVTVADTALRAGETSPVTIAFGGPVTGFDNTDLTVPNGTLSPVSSSDGGTTWTATLTPAASVNDASNVITLDNGGVTSAGGNPGFGTTTSNNYAIDSTRPTATVVVADTDLRAGETSLVTVTFSEAVTGFDSTDLSVANSTLSAVSSSDGGLTWTTTLTPATSVRDASNVITLDNTGIEDLAGNAGTGTTNSTNYSVSTIRPTASIVVADTDLGIGETSLVTITFSEAVSGFDNADLSIANGTLSPVSSTDGGVTWTAILTPSPSTDDATNVITLANGGFQNGDGNTGAGTTTSNNYAISTIPPIPTDLLAPSSAATGPEHSQKPTWTITYTASDAASGVASVDLYVQAPGETTYTKVATDSAAQDGEFTYTGDLDGTYRFHTIATDRAVNVEATPAGADVTTVLDTVTPSSQATGPSLGSARTWTITYDATDATSGIASVDLYVQAPGETTYTKVATDSAAQDGEFTYTGDLDGTYRFHTIATDRAGNVEATPAGPDLITVLDTRAPVLRAAGPARLSFDLSQGRALALRFRVDETVSATFRILERGATVRTFEARAGGPGVLEQRWRGGTDGGARVEPGRYRVVVTAHDAAGNKSRASMPLRVRR